MLRRQKIILALLAETDIPVARTVLVKLAFLIRKETDIALDTSFYDFLPYKYGPFSFALYRELESLQENGYITNGDERVQLTPAMRQVSLEKVEQLTQNERLSVTNVVFEYGKMRQKHLLHEVYKRYPYFACRSEITDLRRELKSVAPVATPAVYSMGYERKSIDAFFDKLIETGIRSVIDVRANPVSRKYGFAGSVLARIAMKLGMQYTHVPSLGIPSELRVALESRASYQRLFDRYERRLTEHEMEIELLAKQMQITPSVLVCVERDVEYCHRSRLAKPVARSSGLPILHL